MEGYRKTVGLVPQSLHQVKRLGITGQDDRLGSMGNEKPLVLFGQSSQRYIVQSQFQQYLQGRRKVPLTAVDQHQVRHNTPGTIALRLGFIPAPGPSGGQPAESTPQHFLHAGIIVHPFYRLNLKAPVVAGSGLAILEHHHAAHHIGALNMRNVVALHPLGQHRQTQLFLQFRHGLLNHTGIVQPLDPLLHQTLGGIFRHHVQQFLVLAALGMDQLDRSSPQLPQPGMNRLLLLQFVLQHDVWRYGQRRLVELFGKLAQHQTRFISLSAFHQEAVTAD